MRKITFALCMISLAFAICSLLISIKVREVVDSRVRGIEIAYGKVDGRPVVFAYSPMRRSVEVRLVMKDDEFHSSRPAALEYLKKEVVRLTKDRKVSTLGKYTFSFEGGNLLWGPYQFEGKGNSYYAIEFARDVHIYGNTIVAWGVDNVDANDVYGVLSESDHR